MDNPHSDFEVEEGKFFIVDAPETAECFRCLIENRSHCSLYKGNRTGYVNDPMGIRLAYDMRDALKRDCWAMLPPDTLSSCLAIAHSLQWATVPEAWEDGRLPPLPITELATLPTDLLLIVHIGGDDEIWLHGPDGIIHDYYSDAV